MKELIADLLAAGFTNRGGKGSHRNFEHAQGGKVTISGKSGDDAKHYQEKVVKQAIAKTKSTHS